MSLPKRLSYISGHVEVVFSPMTIGGFYLKCLNILWGRDGDQNMPVISRLP